MAGRTLHNLLGSLYEYGVLFYVIADNAAEVIYPISHVIKLWVDEGCCVLNVKENNFGYMICECCIE